MSPLHRYAGPSLALLTSLSLAYVAISYNSYAALREREEMRAGVERDKERLRVMRKGGGGKG